MARYTAEHARDVRAVYVNGEQVDHCMECDTELGFAVVYQFDVDGSPVLDGDRIATKVLVGRVQVELAPQSRGDNTEGD